MRVLPQMPDFGLLVKRAKKGDLDAMETIYRLHETPVYSLALRICGKVEDAEDVVQETFLEVAKSIGSYRGEGAFGGWIRKISANKALMKLRSRKRDRWEEPLDEAIHPAPSDHSPGIPPLETSKKVEQIDLEGALSRLSDTARAVVWLHDVEGYTHDEIAGLVGKTPSFSKSQLARAHSRLRDELGAKGGLEPCIQT
jgi:RNA polymerase sigma factor (sigma-70 family)